MVLGWSRGVERWRGVDGIEGVEGRGSGARPPFSGCLWALAHFRLSMTTRLPRPSAHGLRARRDRDIRSYCRATLCAAVPLLSPFCAPTRRAVFPGGRWAGASLSHSVTEATLPTCTTVEIPVVVKCDTNVKWDQVNLCSVPVWCYLTYTVYHSKDREREVPGTRGTTRDSSFFTYIHSQRHRSPYV